MTALRIDASIERMIAEIAVTDLTITDEIVTETTTGIVTIAASLMTIENWHETQETRETHENLHFMSATHWLYRKSQDPPHLNPATHQPLTIPGFHNLVLRTLGS